MRYFAKVVKAEMSRDLLTYPNLTEKNPGAGPMPSEFLQAKMCTTVSAINNENRFLKVTGQIYTSSGDQKNMQPTGPFRSPTDTRSDTRQHFDGFTYKGAKCATRRGR